MKHKNFIYGLAYLLSVASSTLVNVAETGTLALAGAGAFGEKHLDALKLIDGVSVTSLVGRRLEPTQAIAATYGIAYRSNQG